MDKAIDLSAFVTSREQRSVTSSHFPSKRAELLIWQSSSNIYCIYNWLTRNKIDGCFSQLHSTSTTARCVIGSYCLVTPTHSSTTSLISFLRQPFLLPIEERRTLVCFKPSIRVYMAKTAAFLSYPGVPTTL